MKAPRIAFAGMGMMKGWILNLTGLFLCTPRLLSSPTLSSLSHSFCAVLFSGVLGVGAA